MGTADRRTRHRASLRREILDAASQLFVEEGYQRVTMRRIAARIEYSPTTIYLYYKNKNELLAAVCEETFSQLTAKLGRLEKSAGSPLAFLREGLHAYIDFGLSHPRQYTVTFMGPGPGPGLAGQEWQQSAGIRAFETLRRSVGACAESGDVHTSNVEMTAQALWAAVHGMTSLLITQQGFPFADRAVLIDHAIETLIAGLRTPETAPRPQLRPKSKKWDYFN